MKKHFRMLVLTGALALIAAGAVADDSNTDQSVAPKGLSKKHATFAVTGVFTGLLSEEVIINGQSIFISPKATFHRVGQGVVDSGASVRNTAVFLGGIVRGDQLVATMVLIGEPTSTADFSAETLPNAERVPTRRSAR
jgi:hypothetical protein